MPRTQFSHFQLRFQVKFYAWKFELPTTFDFNLLYNKATVKRISFQNEADFLAKLKHIICINNYKLLMLTL